MTRGKVFFSLENVPDICLFLEGCHMTQDIHIVNYIKNKPDTGHTEKMLKCDTVKWAEDP